MKNYRTSVQGLRCSLILGAATAEESSSTVLVSPTLRAELDYFVKNNVDDWDFHEKAILDADLKVIAGALTTNTSCTSLDLRHNKITDVGTHYLAEVLSVNYTVKALLLSDNNIGDIGLGYLCDAMTDPKESLKLLYINKNGITDHGVRALAEKLKLNKSLVDLSLNYNHIGDDGVQALCNVLKSDNTTLKRLHLQGNKIQDSGVDAIIEMIQSHSALEEFKLGHNQISSEPRKQLERTAETRKLLLDLSL
ncbi:unnamed protein product [Rotaria sordida]|uniref:Uncharacterized protein n=1 Tax=Rotaria sordida TaxID=392033 RepID=A0A814U4T8_9BILA|nr:unnamed protein product [Rotaria sordida]CAF1424138.1 unnamed protein product [Rotaria sordida]